MEETKPILSASSSPAHEFSFAVSLHSSTPTTKTAAKPLSPSSSPSVAAKTKQQPPPLAIDLSPADEIFFHGHLLPLHFLSHLHSSSPRPSTHSLDSFALPIPDLLQEEKPLTANNNTTHINICSSCNYFEDEDEDEEDDDDHCISFNKDVINHLQNNYHTKETNTTHDYNPNPNKNNNNNNKPKSFSLFGLSKWKKTGSENKEGNTPENPNNNKRKVKFDVSQIVKRYIKMVKPLLSPRGGGSGRRENLRGRKQSYSFSGTVTPRDNNRGRRGEFSAPASMRTSPTNSGLLLATAGVPSPVSDSTMEELQAAIQAAIAHCKNSSISVEHKSPNFSSSLPVN